MKTEERDLMDQRLIENIRAAEWAVAKAKAAAEAFGLTVYTDGQIRRIIRHRIYSINGDKK